MELGQGPVGLTVSGCLPHRERERIARKTAAKSSLVLQPGPSFSTAQKQRDTERPLRLQQVEVRVQMHNLKVSRRTEFCWWCVFSV